jgi:hypothetical protein
MEGSRGHGTDDTLIISQFRLHTDLRTFTGKHATNGNYPLPDIYRLNKAHIEISCDSHLAGMKMTRPAHDLIEKTHLDSAVQDITLPRKAV